MSESLKNKEMIRYGRNKKNNRNSVLFTFREDGFVFFGVSRCCERDSFNRELGVDIAKARASKAFNSLGSTVPTESAMLNREVTAGWVSVESVPELLSWFRSLNTRKVN